MFNIDELRASASAVYHVMPATPQYTWPLLSKRLNCEVWVKHENHTPTGAFKIRGGIIFINCLLKREPNINGIITATRGNHGQSLALAATKAGLPCYLVVPKGNSREKNAAMQALGGQIIEYGVDFDEARAKAAEIAQQRGLYFVPAFHKDLILGVATYALELFNAVAELDTVYVPVGMGSGICGLIQTRDLLGLKTKIVGIVSDQADAFAQSFEQGKIITTLSADTMADGLACRIPLAESFAMIQRGAERIIRVTDDEVCHAIRIYHEDTHNMAEGAGAAGLAGLIKERRLQKNKKVAVILSGANIDRPLYASILQQQIPTP
ncbi:serine/threonine dehydratase [Raoultella ornithinolytica]|uniref:threonine dehydratase n=1 Tax=Raoultella TaxID=160674 RepID=UPI000B4C5B8A|nr:MULTISPECIES: threonine dehydratase [Raoultella]HDX8328345.1 threonine dehydratase [Raoultella ornithinolytica CD1_MRS_4]EJD6310081.1 threonine dehydratase [Raoultella ornithinolytica]EKV6722979.1 threonine dehydratase [Raoultella ornithinolytica]EKW7680474.1 threonine dehydratase [Raoultella ornithinolytica]ELN4409450.1 threonine dehydratase [Raoultella ornithinolytica]